MEQPKKAIKAVVTILIEPEHVDAITGVLNGYLQIFVRDANYVLDYNMEISETKYPED